MTTKKKRTGQVPRKRADGTGEVTKYLRMPMLMADAVEVYQQREMMSTDAQAIRDLIKRALKTEGLL